MKSWYNATELAGTPGMPISRYGVLKRADRLNWKSRPRGGRGGGNEYHVSVLPEETRAALAARETSREKRSRGKAAGTVAKVDVARLVAEMRRLSERQIEISKAIDELAAAVASVAERAKG